jgi:Zn ribbon nucleic-acid-binding protein
MRFLTATKLSSDKENTMGDFIVLEDCPCCRGNGMIVHEGGWSVQVECADCGSHTVFVEYANEAEKKEAEKKEKEEMIAQFYMLSDEDKADVIANIETYSLEDIEAKLSVICVRNKVSFNVVNEEPNKEQAPTVYNLNNNADDDSAIPAWVKAAIAVSEKKN